MNTLLKAYSAILTLLTILSIGLLLTSCEKPSLDNEATIPADAILFSEVIYTQGWAEVGNIDKVKIYTNGEEFITSQRADSNRHRVQPVDTDREGYYVHDITYGFTLTREQCVFYTPKELTSLYFVL